MTLSLRQYDDTTRKSLRKKISKLRKKLKCKMGVTAEFLAGNYTTRSIDMQWPVRPNRTDLINALIARNGYKSYLEIGCRGDDCFNVITIDYKVGVDPESGGTLRMTSDEFFAQNTVHFDIIFIDGLHIYEQVLRDILNAVQILNEGGTIIMHDCLPTSCLAQYRFPVISAWNGDVWKAFIEARTMPHLDSAACLIDHGVGVIKKRKNTNPLVLQVANCKKLKYTYLVNDYMKLLNALDYDHALAFATEK